MGAHDGALGLLTPLFERWPALGLLPLGLVFGWLDVLTMSYAIHSSAEVAATVGHDTYLFMLTLSIAGFVLLFAVFHRAVDGSYTKKSLYPLVAVALGASILLGMGVDAGVIAPPFLFVEVVLAGAAVAWCFICCANNYARLTTAEVFLYVALSKVTGIVVYLIVASLPVEAFVWLALLLLPVAIAVLLYAEMRLHPCEGPAARGSIFKKTPEEWTALGLSRSLILRFAVASFVLFFIAECSKMTMVAPLGHVDAATSYRLASVVALLLCLVLAFVVAALGERKAELLQTCCYVVIAIMLVLFVAMPLFAEQAPELAWVYSAFRTLLDAVLFSLCFVAIKRTGSSTAQVYFLVCGMHSLGSFVARALLGMPAFSSFFSTPYAILAFDIAASVVLLFICTPRDLALIVGPEPVASPLDGERLDEKTVLNEGVPGRDEEFARAIGLSKRELSVYLLLLRGYTLHLIGEELHISPSTVKTHVSKIYLKAGVTTRANLLKAINDYSK